MMMVGNTFVSLYASNLSWSCGSMHIQGPGVWARVLAELNIASMPWQH